MISTLRLLFFSVGLLQCSNCPAALVSYFDFSDDAPGGSFAERLFNLTGGTTGSLSASSTFSAFTGTTINQIGSVTDSRQTAFVYQGGTGESNNGATLTYQGDFTGFEDPVLTFAGQRSGTGFDAISVATSTDGVSFTSVGSPLLFPTSYSLQTVDLSSIDALDGADSAFIQFTFDGATGANGNARIDNLQINATASVVPEPNAMACLALGAVATLSNRLRRRRDHRKSPGKVE